MELALDVPKSEVSESAASRKSVVGIALSWAASMGTSTKDFFSVSNQVPPGGKDAVAVAMAVSSSGMYYCATLVVYEFRVQAVGHPEGWSGWNKDYLP